jgi:hypothetical protein
MIKLLTLALLLSTTFAFAEEKKQPSCTDLVEKFCDDLYTPEHQGNYDFKAGNEVYPIRLGYTKNDIYLPRIYFYEALRKNRSKLPADIRNILEREKFFKEVDLYLNRKAPKLLTLGDLNRREFNRIPMNTLEELLRRVAWARTEKIQPGYINLTSNNFPSEYDYVYGREIDKVWAEVQTAAWTGNSEWKKVEDLYKDIIAEYMSWIDESNIFTPALKTELKESLKALKLRLPGSLARSANYSKGYKCGTGELNAYYTYEEHEITVCAGYFQSVMPVQTIAHEVGHGIGLRRRLSNYIQKTPAGIALSGLWDREMSGKQPKCSEWKEIKAQLEKGYRETKPYVYEDGDYLNGFLSKKLEPIPQGADLLKLATRFAKATVRNDVDHHYTENTLKQDEILGSGRLFPNFRFHNPLALYQYPIKVQMYDWTLPQFEMMFAASYNCELEKGKTDPEALRVALEEAQQMAIQSWQMVLTIGGKFHYSQDAADEGYAQVIEEDVADAYASKIMARLLKKNPDVEERRARFYSTVASYCDEPSFRKKYPEETKVLKSFSNEPHSVGFDRRQKLLGPEVREALQCL